MQHVDNMSVFTQKEYLIIIIISPKYYETVTASPVGLENDERTFNTVYIHKQVRSCITELEFSVCRLPIVHVFVYLYVSHIAPE